jgi:hypothetical protein
VPPLAVRPPRKLCQTAAAQNLCNKCLYGRLGNCAKTQKNTQQCSSISVQQETTVRTAKICTVRPVTLYCTLSSISVQVLTVRPPQKSVQYSLPSSVVPCLDFCASIQVVRPAQSVQYGLYECCTSPPRFVCQCLPWNACP